MNKTICQFLEIKVEHGKPFTIKNEKGLVIYYENWNGFWRKQEFDEKGNTLFSENSDGFWFRREFDESSKIIYYCNSEGTIIDNRPKPEIVMTLQEIADKLGIAVEQLRIKDKK